MTCPNRLYGDLPGMIAYLDEVVAVHAEIEATRRYPNAVDLLATAIRNIRREIAETENRLVHIAKRSVVLYRDEQPGLVPKFDGHVEVRVGEAYHDAATAVVNFDALDAFHLRGAPSMKRQMAVAAVLPDDTTALIPRSRNPLLEPMLRDAIETLFVSGGLL